MYKTYRRCAFISIMLGTAFITLALLTIFRQWTLTGIDDADITQVYARNIANGFGVVFTPGYERVEGSTSLAWTLIVTAANLLAPHPEWLVLLVAMLLTASSLWQFYKIFERLFIAESLSSLALSLIFAAWLLMQPGYYAWNIVTLMDVTLWSFLIAWSARLTIDFAVVGLRKSFLWGLCLCSIMLVLTRPEAMLFVPFLLFLWAIIAFINKQSLVAKALLIPSTVFTIALGLLLGGRKVYFGFPFPNTYYAKVQLNFLANIFDGVKYDLKFLVQSPWMGALFLFLVVSTALQFSWLLKGRLIGRKAYAQLAINIIVLCGFALPLLVGGDHFASSRFLQPFIPLIIFPFLSMLAPALKHSDEWLFPTYRRVAFVFLIATTSISVFLAYDDSNALKGEFRLAEWGRETGLALDAVFSNPKPTVGVTAAGGVAFSYEGRILDLLGLNWAEMAHGPKDARGYRGHDGFSSVVFWKHPPDILLPFVGASVPLNGDFSDKFDKKILNGLQDTNHFRESYTAGYIPLDGKYLVAYFNNDWLGAFNGRQIVLLPWR